mmetsp:Transcript_15397/g.25211  ORF Transcript_15397/g.25211 Transcript_15397/m.25211 type:complete len:204 (-) Transcript_15397:1029-1640(-)
MVCLRRLRLGVVRRVSSCCCCCWGGGRAFGSLFFDLEKKTSLTKSTVRPLIPGTILSPSGSSIKTSLFISFSWLFNSESFSTDTAAAGGIGDVDDTNIASPFTTSSFNFCFFPMVGEESPLSPSFSLVFIFNNCRICCCFSNSLFLLCNKTLLLRLHFLRSSILLYSPSIHLIPKSVNNPQIALTALTLNIELVEINVIMRCK